MLALSLIFVCYLAVGLLVAGIAVKWIGGTCKDDSPLETLLLVAVWPLIVLAGVLYLLGSLCRAILVKLGV